MQNRRRDQGDLEQLLSFRQTSLVQTQKGAIHALSGQARVCMVHLIERVILIHFGSSALSQNS